MTLVDTCFLVDLMRGDRGATRTMDAFAAEGWTFHVPVVALHELHRGLGQVRRPTVEWERIKAAVTGVPAMPMDAESARIAGQIEGALKSHGSPIDVEDCMIAGIALRHGMAVLTRNVEDFGRIQGLDVVTY